MKTVRVIGGVMVCIAVAYFAQQVNGGSRASATTEAQYVLKQLAEHGKGSFWADTDKYSLKAASYDGKDLKVLLHAGDRDCFVRFNSVEVGNESRWQADTSTLIPAAFCISGGMNPS